jgi:uncharacterized protein (DUF849 family)
MVREKVIISCAITGSIHTPSMSEYLPVTPNEIAESAIGAAKAGAAIVHLHARDPQTGRPSSDPAIYQQFLPKIRDASDVLINITTGGSFTMTIEERTAAATTFEPELCSLNMGSMNFGLYQMAEKPRTWKHDWEKPHLEKTKDAIFRNTFGDVEIITARLGKERGARFEFECYDVSHIYNLAHFLERGIVQAPLFVQFVLGIHGGIAAEPEHLMHLKQTADRVLGDAYTFSVAAAGRSQYPLITLGAILGGHVRVGLEDNLYLGKGRPAKSNAAMVTQAREILQLLSLDIATPDEARTMLATKGAAKVKI